MRRWRMSTSINNARWFSICTFASHDRTSPIQPSSGRGSDLLTMGTRFHLCSESTPLNLSTIFVFGVRQGDLPNFIHFFPFLTSRVGPAAFARPEPGEGRI